MSRYSSFRSHALTFLVGMALIGDLGNSFAEDAIQFNTQFLDVKDGSKFDLNRFSRKGYVMPGKYTLQVMVNQSQIAQERIVNYITAQADNTVTFPCLPPELIAQFGLKTDVLDKLRWINSGACLMPNQLDGV